MSVAGGILLGMVLGLVLAIAAVVLIGRRLMRRAGAVPRSADPVESSKVHVADNAVAVLRDRAGTRQVTVSHQESV